MKAVLFYGSSRGNTKLVASRIQSQLHFPVDIFDVKSELKTESFVQYELFLFFASTWGDGELQVDMENFLDSHSLDLKGKKYALCELGNYYGYDDFEFGALRIMRHYLQLTGGEELVTPFCMDSLPHKDWNGLGRWCKLLNESSGTLS